MSGRDVAPPVAGRELMARQLANGVGHGSAAHVAWLEEWREAALDVLARQDAALSLLQGYEVVTQRLGEHEARALAADLREYGIARIVRTDAGGASVVAASTVHPLVGRTIVSFFETVVEVADGTTSITDV